uniref:Dynein heavy chain tail domain-containing protein n=1 Tax=Echeneis naucrates TaxID=173247 RepID=A0A665V7Z7_ECHNA
DFYEDSVKSREQLPVRDELLNRMQKFLGAVNTTLQHLRIQGLIYSNLEPEVNVLLSNPEIVEKLEQCVMNWQTHITIVIEEQLRKSPQGPGPMAEIAFWQERAFILCALNEQLKQPVVRKILDVITKADAGIIQTMEETAAELLTYCVESKENIRFLRTLERHFLNLATATSFGVILETIPALMESLQIVWIISCHYNTNERMVPLMERIAWQLCEHASQAIDVRTVFKYREVSKTKVCNAKQILDKWKSSYFEMRAEIEESGRDSRWEFDRKRLFEKTDYMASVCQDLYNALQILEEFYNIFGPELKGVTGDPKRIDEVLCRVDSLVLPIEEVSFNPFDICKIQSWKKIMQDFDSTVQTIEGEAISFIDQSFKTLRSAAAAFNMLMKFKHIRSRESINQHLMRKFNDILVQYSKEVASMNEIFEAKQNKPPLNKYEPPVAGSIRWARTLLYPSKQTLLPFLDVPEMAETEKCKYVAFAMKLKDYEVKRFNNWETETKNNLPLLMKKTLLAASQYAPPANGNLQRGVRYALNFSPEIREIISEARNLVPMGYSVPYLAQSVALQEHKFIRYGDDLNNILSCFHSALDSLSEAKFSMLSPQINAVKKVLLFGCKRLNWTSLGIPEFIRRATQAVSKFESVVNQIQKNETDIESKLQSIATANLLKFPVPVKTNELPGVKEFCERIERERVKTVNLLTRKYSDIGPLITKIEHLIMETSSGKAKSMEEYYMHWEHQVLDSLVKMVMSASLMGSTVLFQIDVILSAPKIVLQPQNNEIYRLIMQCIRDCVESTKQFMRWMRGTCIECPPQCVGGEDELVTFNFYSDICQHPEINESAMTVSQNIQRLLVSVDRFLNHWKRYRPLWEKNKTIVNEKFAARKPSCVMYDDKLQFFARIKQELMQEHLSKNEHSIHLNLEPLANTVHEIAESWISSLGSLLNKPAKEDLFSLRDEFMVWHYASLFDSYDYIIYIALFLYVN